MNITDKVGAATAGSSDDLLGEPMVHYAHKQDPEGIRFIQYEKDQLPQWAVDVQPCSDQRRG